MTISFIYIYIYIYIFFFSKIQNICPEDDFSDYILNKFSMIVISFLFLYLK